MTETAIRDQVSSIIGAMAASVRQEPAQFSISITAIGASSDQGRASNNFVNFSGSGSNNVGLQYNATFNRVTLQPAVDAKAEWAPSVAARLDELARLLESVEPDRSRADELVASLGALAAPASLITAINGLLGIVWPW